MKKPYSFDPEKGTFTLTDPETGKDWSNHLFNNLSYVSSITHLGITYSRYLNKDAVQVTLNCPLSSFVYLRDRETGKYWNPSGYPAVRKVSHYRCEHGQKYVRISSVCTRIFAETVYAIAEDDTREVWRVRVKNESDRTRVIDLFAATEFDLNGFAQPVYYNAVTTSATSFEKEVNAVYCQNENPCRPHNLSNGYILCSEPVKAFEGNYEVFIGTTGTISAPRILELRRDLNNTTATVRRRGGILETKLTLLPGEEKTVCFVLGLISSREELRSRAKEFISTAEDIVSAALAGEDKYGKLRTRSPEEQVNRIFNYWAEHQVEYCMLGKKAVRDNAQLGMAALNFDVALAKKTIDECVTHQYADGHATLTWFPYPEKNIYSDPSCWLVYAACEYVKESGDFNWLNESAPYLDGGSGTMWEHLKRAVEWFSREDNYGEHGLPRIHHADWNDALNIPDENAESVLMAMFVCKMFSDLEELALRLGENAFAKELSERRQELKNTVNKVAFNGKYYVRAFSRFGVVGDRSTDGVIYVNPQSWSILADVCPEERLPLIIAAMDGMETDRGIPLCAPPYAKYDEHVGRMSGMLPGVYENGAIYNHAGCFKVMADCKLGRGDHALSALMKIIPDGKSNPSSITTAEPYVFTNCYLTHPSVDMKVGFSWQTGTSSWGLKCYYEGILGLKRTYDGLKVAPAFPSAWKSAEAWRIFRGDKLHFIYRNLGGEQVSLTVDGKEIKSDMVPFFGDGKEHTVTVTLRKGRSTHGHDNKH